MTHTFIRTLSSLGLLLFSHAGYSLDLLEAYELAEKFDPQYQAALSDYRSVQLSRGQTESALLPQVTLDVYAQQVKQESASPFSLGDYDTSGYSLSLDQAIYKHDNYLKLEQADLSIAAAAADLSAAAQALILRIAEAYFDVLSAEDNYTFAQAEKKAIEQQLFQTKQRFDAGMIPVTDVKESQAQYDLSDAMVILAENGLATSRETLRGIIGFIPDSLDVLSEELVLEMPQPADIDEWVKTADSNNLALKSAQYAYEIAGKQVKVDRSGHYPSLALSLTHNDTSTDTDTTTFDTEDTSLLLNLSIPVYAGGSTSSKTEQALVRQERAGFIRDKTRQDTIRLSRNSYLGVTSSIAQVRALKQALISARAAHEATREGFKAGTRTSVEVLSGLRDQYRAERDYAQARYDYVLNVLRLKQAAGVLSKQDVVQTNQWIR